MSKNEDRIADFLRKEAEIACLPSKTYGRVLRGAKVRRAVTAAIGTSLVIVIVIVMVGLVTGRTVRSRTNVVPATSQTPSPYPSRTEVEGCPLTIPDRPAFVPPPPYPSQVPNPNVPDADEKVWYGTAALWTWLETEGEVWRDLPDDDGNGKLFEKTFWWSDDFSPEKGFGPIRVTGRRLDGPGSFDTEGPGGGGSREDIGSFMLVGVEMSPGCWEVTASYRDTRLSYVVLVKD